MSYAAKAVLVFLFLGLSSVSHAGIIAFRCTYEESGLRQQITAYCASSDCIRRNPLDGVLWIYPVTLVQENRDDFENTEVWVRTPNDPFQPVPISFSEVKPGLLWSEFRDIHPTAGWGKSRNFTISIELGSKTGKFTEAYEGDPTIPRYTKVRDLTCSFHPSTP
jgi:hypothetical protein